MFSFMLISMFLISVLCAVMGALPIWEDNRLPTEEEWNKIHAERIRKAKKYVKRMKKGKLIVGMPTGCATYTAIRSKVVLCAINSSGNKIYMHAHNM